MRIHPLAFVAAAALAAWLNPGAEARVHDADVNRDGVIDTGELLRVLQLHHGDGYHCDAGTADGYAPGAGTQTCAPHDGDYAPEDFRFGLSEVLRVVQLHGAGAYHDGADTEDGFGLYATAPLFSVPGGTFSSPFMVRLGGAPPDAEIRYTTDGSVPSAVSPQYTGPLSISDTTAVHARFFHPAAEPGPVATTVYVRVDWAAADFDSNLPLVVVNSRGYDFSQDDDVTGDYPYEEVYAAVIDAAAGRASILGGADWAGRAGMHVRGASSAAYPKKQYKFEVWDENDEDRDASLLGMPEEADWILYAPYFDKTLMRNHLVYRWWEALGYWSPRTRFVEVFISMDGGPVGMDDYVGVYVLLENVERDGDRLDVEPADPTATAEPEITGGYILQVTNILQHLTLDSGVRLKFEEPDVEDDLPLHKAWIEDHLNAFETMLYGAGFTDPVTGYRAWIDVPSHLDYDIMRELTRNIDGASTWFSKDRNGPIVMGPLWDYNQSLGMTSLFDNEHGWEPEGWNTVYMYQMRHWANWWGRLDDDPDYQLAWEDRWTELRRDVLSNDRLLGDMDATALLLEEGQQRNYERWPVLGQSVWGTTEAREAPGYADRDTYAKEVQWMRDWLETRLAWMDGQVRPAPAYSQHGGAVPAGFQLTVTNPWGRGEVYYTTDGSDPRVPVHVAGDTTTLVAEGAAKTALVPSSDIGTAWREPGYDDGAWRTGAGGVGYEREPGAALNFSALIGLDVNDLLYGAGGTCYVRVPFNVDAATLTSLAGLALSMRYDDGFVAFLNGREVARRNAPITPAWNSVSLGGQLDENALVPERFDISDELDLLREGENVLAIHGLNVTATSSDFLILPSLTASRGTPGGVADGALQYTGPIVLGETTRVRARAFDGATWTPLADAVFSMDTLADALRVTELMYHPPDAPDGDPLAEFVEVMNVSGMVVNPRFARFTDGIDFTFPDRLLAPGERVVIAADEAAFTAAYGVMDALIGVYEGRLNNGGERIVLEDAAGVVAQDFTFDDAWYPETDGGGYSLVAADPAQDDAAWSTPGGWRTSATPGGTPATE